MSLFKLRGELSSSQNWILGIIGLIIFVGLWWLTAELNSNKIPVIEGFESRLDNKNLDLDSLAIADSVSLANATEFTKTYPAIPPPLATVQSYPELITKDNLAWNAWKSIWLNLKGYFWAIMISIPIGFLLGLLPLFRGLFSKQVDALRFLPLTALVGTFMTFYGVTEDKMRVAFLAFGIMVYLIPVVVQRVFEVKDVYLKTVFTLGATDWQTIKRVYIPSVMSKLMDDIRVLTAISWTYIIIAELLGAKEGLGRLIWMSQRQGQTEKVFAILLLFIVIGFFQDRIFAFIDKRMFPHKYLKMRPSGLKESQMGIALVLGVVALGLILTFLVPSLVGSINSMMMIAVIAGVLFILYGEFKIFQSKPTA